MKRWLLLLCLAMSCAAAEPKQVRVFIALCDNKTQGIIPVGAKIGNGDDPDANLYWGCTDGFGSFFKKSKQWKTLSTDKDLTPDILRRVKLQHSSGKMILTAEAYRGSAMRQCLTDFEKAATSGTHDLVAFIGHNGLMDFQLPLPTAAPENKTEIIVLCCHSQPYFGDRLSSLGCHPILMTQQLMYPGSFILHAALEQWHKGANPSTLRTAAAAAYAKNQGISTKAAASIFAVINR